MTDRQGLLQDPGSRQSTDPNQGILPREYSHNGPQEGKSGKKKGILIGGAVLLVAVVLILVFTLKGGSDDDGGDTPIPGGAYNPYSVDESSVTKTKAVYSGNITMSESKLQELNSFNFLEKVAGDNDTKIEASPRSVPTGANNQLIKKVKFEVGQSDFKTAYIRLTDAENERYSIPDDIVNKPSSNPTMDLEMLGFEMFNSPFGFRFSDKQDPTNQYLSTIDSTFIMMDKYIQLDLNLPSRRIYGLGERNTNFALGEGSWTMWASG